MKTAKNSSRTAGHLAVFWLAESPAVADFCGETKIDSLFSSRENSKSSENS
jgi:hypothetical protein